jgi:hypothetical protein
MPALRNSRYQHSTTYTDTAGRRFLTEPPLIPYVDSLENRVHVVRGGERLQDIAHQYFAALGDDVFPAAALWYIVAQFQPTPIIDPTLRLSPGLRLYIPSKAYVMSRVFDKSRRDK